MPTTADARDRRATPTRSAARRPRERCAAAATFHSSARYGDRGSQLRSGICRGHRHGGDRRDRADRRRQYRSLRIASGREAGAGVGPAVVTVERHGDADLLDGGSQSATWRGCARRRGTQVVLEQGTSSFSGGHVAKSFKLAGEFVAYLAEDWTKSETTDSVTAVSLTTGQRWHSDAINPLTGTGTGFEKLAVNRQGAAAWIGVTIADDGHRRWRLFLR